jgi:hypothetical protein
VSSDRRHTDVIELGWLDFLAACARDPLVRVEGHDVEATANAGRLVRFNLALRVRPDTGTGGSRPRVHAERLRRSGDQLLPTGRTIELRWEEVDWVSWEPWRDPSGRRAKVTVTGRSDFGTLRVYEDGRLVDEVTRQISHWGSYDRAVEAAMRLTGLQRA